MAETTARPVHDWILTPHAAEEMRRRGIDASTVARVLEAPERRLTVRVGRDVIESRIAIAGKTYLVRVFVDVDRRPAEVVTAYRTSKIAKYWSGGP